MKKLNIYFTAGIPTLEDTAEIMKTIQNSGADMMKSGCLILILLQMVQLF